MEHTSELALIKRVVELGDDVIVSTPNTVKSFPLMPNMTSQKAKTRAMTIAMIGILVMPIYGLFAGDENLWERLQAFVENERGAKSQSAVLAVDTAGLRVRSKGFSPATKEFYEQAVLEHLARLQHTANSWSERNQELMGSVFLKITIDSSGNVVRVETTNSHVNDSSFMKTVMDDVREWKFSNGGVEAAELTVPLLFIPKGMDPEMIVQWERKVRNGRLDDSPIQRLPGVTALAAVAANNKMTAAAAPAISMQRQVKNIGASSLAPEITPKPGIIATTATAPRETDAGLSKIVIANRQLAIRIKPRYSASSLRQVEQSTQLSILENRGDWLKVRTAQGDVTGFIRKEYVSTKKG
ncbi:MAG TPA: AgmX/PglI C-terminal domain-containing protein [Candidatus Binatia bacterium]|nr:AgmX/PglI C-terminal domain-containing protein [Candidatus Binatia bacterium]